MELEPAGQAEDNAGREGGAVVQRSKVPCCFSQVKSKNGETTDIAIINLI